MGLLFIWILYSPLTGSLMLLHVCHSSGNAEPDEQMDAQGEQKQV